ncbi:MAG: Adenosylhomocysteinase [Firmicutes bacterium ADurb.Bin193]|nr:MAG: Adenosylhomocysteinase [Firmicutes bacterium ADurb.Bin193]
MSVIRDKSLYPSGIKKIEWVKNNMRLLGVISEDFKKRRPFEGVNIAVSIHLEAKTAYFAKTLATGGAKVAITGSNPLSTQDDIAAALALEEGISVYAWHGASEDEYTRHLNMALDIKPDIIIDDGGDLVGLLHGERRELAKKIYGGCEETTTGVMRLRAKERDKSLLFPMISVNDAKCKYLFDNRYGTGQSVWDGINRTTNLMVCGKTVVVAGYGWCGKGVAMRAKGLGAKVIITEVSPLAAIEAVMDGFTVMPMIEAAKLGDLFITLTGCKRVIGKEHFAVMKDGVILANAGHFDVEICIPELEEISVSSHEARKNITEYLQKDGRRINLLAEGRLVNLAAGDGHPAEIMDMSFALQSLCAEYILKNHKSLTKKVYGVPDEINEYVAMLRLKAFGVDIDSLTDSQKEYLEARQV